MGCLLKGGGGLYSRLVVGVVLLAAGSASRMGNRPKALLELGGVPLIRRQLIALSGAGVDELVVVLGGPHAQAIEAVVQDFPVTLATNPDPSRGQASSVRTGLAALRGKLDAVLIALADQPLINAEDLTALIGAFKKRGDASMVVPRVRDPADGTDQPGNPVIVEAALAEQWLAGDANAACRMWREQNPERVRWFDTGNMHFRVDLDTPEDLERFAQRTGHALRWPAALNVPTANTAVTA